MDKLDTQEDLTALDEQIDDDKVGDVPAAVNPVGEEVQSLIDESPETTEEVELHLTVPENEEHPEVTDVTEEKAPTADLGPPLMISKTVEEEEEPKTVNEEHLIGDVKQTEDDTLQIEGCPPEIISSPTVEEETEQIEEPMTKEREELLERYTILMEEKKRVTQMNSEIQNKLANYFCSYPAYDTQDKKQITPLDLEKQYFACTSNIENLKKLHKEALERSEKQIENLRTKQEKIANKVENQFKALSAKKRIILVEELRTRLGTVAALREVEKFQTNERQKETEIIHVRLDNIKIKHKNKKLYNILRSKEEVRERVHLTDFEQMKEESLTHGEKIDKRNAEVLALENKFTDTITNLTHIREKLLHTEKNTEKKKAHLVNLEAILSQKQAMLRKTKKIRDNLREDNIVLTQQCEFLGNKVLLDDYENKMDDTMMFSQKLDALRQKYAEFKMTCQVVKNRLGYHPNDLKSKTDELFSVLHSFSSLSFQDKEVQEPKFTTEEAGSESVDVSEQDKLESEEQQAILPTSEISEEEGPEPQPKSEEPQSTEESTGKDSNDGLLALEIDSLDKIPNNKDEEGEEEREETEEVVAINHDELLEQYNMLIEEKKKITNLNVKIQEKLGKFLSRTVRRNVYEEKEKTVELEEHYLNLINNMENLKNHHTKDNEIYQLQIEDLKNIHELKNRSVESNWKVLLNLKKDILIEVLSRRQGTKAATKVGEKFHTDEQQRQLELIKMRVKNIELKHQIKKLEVAVKIKEKIEQDLHLTDFELLKIDSQSYNARIEEREAELKRSQKKIANTLQMIKNIKEKLYDMQMESIEKKSQVVDMDELVHKKQALLRKIKKRREFLRLENIKLDHNRELIGNEVLLRDFEDQFDATELLSKQLKMLRRSYNEFTRSCKAIREKIDKPQFFDQRVQ
ncbi:CCD96 protein, partial [Polypterus senegalus]